MKSRQRGGEGAAVVDRMQEAWSRRPEMWIAVAYEKGMYVFYGAYNYFGLVRQVSGFCIVSVISYGSSRLLIRWI